MTDASRSEVSGYLGVRAQQNLGDQKKNEDHQSAVAVFKSRTQLDRDLLAIQFRPSLAHSSQRRASVDELYWDHQLSPVLFTFLGRRRVVNGVAIGRNPSDFFNQGKSEDYTLTDSDRRTEKKGDDMVGWSYFGRAYSIQSILATPTANSKRTRAMVQVNRNFDSLSSDMSLVAYYADRPAFGMNLSTALGESATAYAETALRKGRDRQRPQLSSNSLVTSAIDDTNRWTLDLVVGGQYTTDIGITLTAEYWHNGNGFSSTEYAGIVNSLASGQGNLILAGKFLGTRGLRKNSGFLRISEIPVDDATKGEITWIRNLDDGSSFVRGAICWETSKTDSIRVGIDSFSGSQFSEYGSSNANWRVFLAYQRYF